MKTRALTLIIAWVFVTGLAFCWGLPARGQTTKGAMWLALNVALGPLPRVAHELQNPTALSSLLAAYLAMICTSFAWHLRHRTAWSWVLLTSLWFSSGLMFSIGLFI